ncbi:amino acid ABC transporter substrate-binding protein/permease [Lentilactobacillus hilgardii]|jgi:polar amino acid transport system substrate-binding protein|uniref:ABC transporter permease subunit n=1 Tax=Lentilactobacillus hilgardii TaxID=1588 RepID=A0A6P1E7T9_LENHI|nr:ABC transporter, permease protein [Lentilactobacillus buchneri ATCC 11577]EEI70486.1 ABC transporter, permease protein [Lentilactobacillus hilgardii ATCC 27305]MCT3390276.1 ABC transporter permease subunit [Lentilactobacillus hilgardii]MCT3397105.1 ABC transporter permease subunit [Lentilactobacillus hilgardii]QHB51792.1 ABC transporter permease subunit [Lentilactobacillus hilgardii]
MIMNHKLSKAQRWVVFLMTFLTCLIFSNIAAQAKTYQIGTDVTYPPFEFANKQNKYVGIDIDIMNAIAKEEGFKVHIKPVGFNAAVQSVQSGQEDGVIAGMTITPDRQAKFDFGTPYYKTGVVMAVAKSSHITNFKQLKGKRVALKTGTAAADYANSIKKKYGFKTVTFDDSDNMYQDVTTGNSVACFEDQPVMQYGIKQGLKLKIVTKPANTGWYGFAVKKGTHKALVSKFNAGLKKIRANGTYDKIVGQYLGSNANQAVKGKTFTIGTDVTFPPFEFANKQNKYVGIDMDLVRAIANEQGFKVKIKPLGFNAAVQAVESGQIDGVIAGMSITNARKAQFNFSNPYFTSGVVMAVNKKSKVKSLSQLRGKKVAVKTGTAGADYANSIKKKYGFTVTTFDDSNNMYQDVTTGNSAACFEDHPVMQYAIKQGTKLKIVTKPAESAPYGFAVKKGHNKALLAAFNNGLKDLKASGTYDDIKAKYLGSSDALTTTKSTGSSEDRTFLGLIKQNQGALLSGLKETMWLTVVSIFFATIFGIVVGLMGVVPGKFFNWLSSILIYLFRGMPLLVLALFIYTGIPSLTGEKIPAFVAGVVTLTFNEGAYIAAFVKGGIQAVDPGQMEAARSLGLPFGKSMRKVILPQGIRIMIPSFINQFIITLKDTSILSIIGLLELTQTGKIIIARNLEGFKVWTIVALMYLIIITLLTWLSNWVQRRTKV